MLTVTIANQSRIHKKIILFFVFLISCIAIYASVFYATNLITNRYHELPSYAKIQREEGISIFIVVEKDEDLRTEYDLAFHTMQCYCSAKSYPLVVLDISRNVTLQKLCPQNFMFRRHCALAMYLQEHPAVQWVLFIDADAAIINPSHFLEEYLPKISEDDGDKNININEKRPDLIFYERIFNGEISAGSYFARNTNSTIEFLHFWANYYYQLPRSWHGSDNGAIHAVFMDKFCRLSCSARSKICLKLWKKSENDDGLRMFSDCAKSILGNRNAFISESDKLNVHFLTDFRDYWSRDIWLTQSKWSSRDFILHGLKRSWKNSTTWGGWESPFSAAIDKKAQLSAIFDLNMCLAAKVEWPYEIKYISSNGDIEKILFLRVQNMRIERMDYLRRIEKYAITEMVL